MEEGKTPKKGMGVYAIVEMGFLATAFSIIYAFGMLRFATGLAQLFSTRGAKIAAALTVIACAVTIAVTFIDAVSRLIKDNRGA